MSKKAVRRIIAAACIVLLASMGILGVLVYRAVQEQKLAAFEAMVRQELSESDALRVEGLALSPYKTDFVTTYEQGGHTLADIDEAAGETTVLVRTLTPVITADHGSPLHITLEKEGATAFSGSADAFRLFIPPDDGPYSVTVTADVATARGEGSFTYRFTLSYDAPPTFTLSSDHVMQGDTLVLRAVNVRDDVTAAVDYDYVPFVVRSGSVAEGYIPVNHVMEAGEYHVTVTYDGEEYDLPFTVGETEFEVQHLTVDSSTASATIYSSNANAEYAAVMYPLFDSFDPNVYWEGAFLEPVTDYWVSTEYGIKRYTNGSSYPSRHAGVDMACAEGTPIIAPNHGKILFSGYLQLSGNTIIVEHGMGLHSVYLHMSELNCAEGDMVEKGEVIGYVGSTGFSTGPHLHFQLMIGGMSISPWLAFDGTGGLYNLAVTQSIAAE